MLSGGGGGVTCVVDTTVTVDTATGGDDDILDSQDTNSDTVTSVHDTTATGDINNNDQCLPGECI